MTRINHRYKGYEMFIEFESGEVTVYKHDRLVHRAGSLDMAKKWIDKQGD